MKNELPQSLIDRKVFIVKMLKDGVLATKRNFLPLTYDMKQIVMGSSMADDNYYIYMPIDTSHMSVISILEEEEKLIKDGKDGSLKLVKIQEMKEMLAATDEMCSLLEEDQQNEPDKKKIEALFDKYPTLQSWLNE